MMKMKIAVGIAAALVGLTSADARAQGVSAGAADREGNGRLARAKTDQATKTTATFANEFSVSFATNVESPNSTQPEAIGSVFFGAKNDNKNEKFIFRNIGFKDACYAYNLRVEFVDDLYKPRFRVSFQEYDRETARLLREVTGLYGCASKKDLVVLPITHLPEPQLIAEGDTIALEILSNPDTGLEIVDLVQVVRNGGAKEKPKAPRSH